MSNERNVPRLLSVKELSHATSLPQWRIYELINKAKALPCMRVGKTFRFPSDGVVQWIHEQASKKESGS